MYQYPEMASHFKAKRLEIFNKYMCSKVVELTKTLPCTDLVGRVRGTMCWAYLMVHKTFDDAGLFLTNDEAAQAQKYANLFLTSLQKLCVIDIKQKIWKARPKHHQLDHLVDELKINHMNPKQICCLLEDCIISNLWGPD
jgi:hypothetical protein